MVPSDLLTDPLTDPVTGWRARLRAVPVFDDDLPGFEVASAPEDPLVLVAEWLDNAIESAVPQPHAAAFITVAAAVSRAHTRLQYARAGGAAWSHGMLAE